KTALAVARVLPVPSRVCSQYRSPSLNQEGLTQYDFAAVEVNGSVPPGPCPRPSSRPDARCNHRSLLRAGTEASRKASAHTNTTNSPLTTPGQERREEAGEACSGVPSPAGEAVGSDCDTTGSGLMELHRGGGPERRTTARAVEMPLPR